MAGPSVGTKFSDKYFILEVRDIHLLISLYYKRNTSGSLGVDIGNISLKLQAAHF